MLGIAEGIMGIVKPVLDKFVPDADVRLEAENFLLKSIQASDLAQMEVNKQEAKHASVFVAGWRPFVGWTCGSGMAYQWVLRPFLEWGATIASLPVPPPLDLSSLVTVLGGMLGLGLMRMNETVKGVARSRL